MNTSQVVEQFARRILDAYGDAMDSAARQMAVEALGSGEPEVAATMAVELAPVTANDVDDFLALVTKSFTGVDAVVATRSAAAARARLGLSPSHA